MSLKLSILSPSSNEKTEDVINGENINIAAVTSDSNSPSSLQNSTNSLSGGGHDFRVQPIVSKCTDLANASIAEGEDSEATTMLATRLMKRCNEEMIKKYNVEEEEEEEEQVEGSCCGRDVVIALSLDMSKKRFPKIWEEHDEIVIMKELIEFIENGGDPFVDLDEFIETIINKQDSLHFSLTVKQLMVKMRKLKTKYQNMANRANKGEEDPVIVDPHELKCYPLMKQIWGTSEAAVRIDVKNKNKNKNKNKIKNKFESRNEMGVEAKRKSLPLTTPNPPLSIFPCVGDLMGLDMNLFDAQSDPKERVLKGEKDSIEKRKLLVDNAKAHLKWIDWLREKAIKTQEMLESSDSLDLPKVPNHES